MPVQWRMPDADRMSAVVAGVVLAAGASTRMGRNKLLLKLEGMTLVRRAAVRAVEAGLTPVIVVLGHDAVQTRAELDGLSVIVEVSGGYQEGTAASLRTGIGALAPHVGAVVVMLADMPLVTPEMLATLVERYRKGTAPLVVSNYDGVAAPPVLYDRCLFSELLASTGDRAGREIVHRHRAAAEIVHWPASALRDLDLPADYEQLRTRTDAT
jgi:molybdenum cofactor cytidylyltransferase